MASRAVFVLSFVAWLRTGDEMSFSNLSPLALSFQSGFTPLHIAAHYGNVEIAKFLISKGADVNFEARVRELFEERRRAH